MSEPPRPRQSGVDERVLVTGGSGFIGTNLVASYLREQTPVISLDRRPPRIPAHRSVWTQTDVRDLEQLGALLAGFAPTVIVHLAARTDLRGRAASDYDTNTHGVENLITASADISPPPRILFTSSRLVCEIGYLPEHDTDWRPSTPDGSSKVRGEQIVRERCLHAPWVITRPTSIWGPWFGAPYRSFFEAVLAGRYLHPRGQEIRKSFGYVDNTVHQIRQLARAPVELVADRVFYLADYEPLETGAFADAISCAGPRAGVRRVPVGLLRALARGGDIMRRLGWSEPPLTSFRLNNLLSDMVFDLSPVKSVVGDLPVPWREGVQRTVRWLNGSQQPPSPNG
jgi:nucleoside-diphosphate-sugar epimerase